MAKSFKLKKSELKEFLDEKAHFYENPKFIESDPIQVVHRFHTKQDREISGFLTATIAWGNRKSIINNATRMMLLMDNDPHNFILNHTQADLENLSGFVHRTFNGTDLKTFIKALHHIYKHHGGLEEVFLAHAKKNSLQESIHHFKKHFFEIDHLARTQKHISDPLKKSAAKRINMYLRWMVRPADAGVDFGIWRKLHPAQLSCPLDVHSGRVARQLGLLKRKQNDAAALNELDAALRKLDAQDPVKYDYALFGLGVFEKDIFKKM
ncbi:MAG: TIGR02757 family protein [Cytophagaceae bacterium]|nr:TIGR02757 family protein [Cytophagaceae bacterium]|tara:strand:+ start:4288 stop:5085 length:798 start_codon:yes stop_codon:yes gene_type:complete